MAAAIQAGDHGPRTQFIENMFIPTSDRQLVENILAVMLAAPPYVARAAMRGALEFDCQAAAVLCKVPALQLAASPPRTLPQSITERLQNLVNGCTVGAGHFNQLEVPDQVNAMIEAFLRHYVRQEPANGTNPSHGFHCPTFIRASAVREAAWSSSPWPLRVDLIR